MSDAPIRSVNPANPDEVVAEVAQPSEAELKAMPAAALEAQPAWTDATERGAAWPGSPTRSKSGSGRSSS